MSSLEERSRPREPNGEPEVLEPGGILEWEWRTYDNIPENLSVGAALTIKALKENLMFYDFVE